jgi:DNA polymerase-3 subunit alpha
MNIPVLPPDVNKSFEGFGVNKSNNKEETDTIRFGLTTIKNFGEGVGHVIVEERKKNGEYKSLSDFLSRVKDKNLNKKSLESLIKAGALDSLTEDGLDRYDLLFNIDLLLSFSKEEREKENDQSSLFSDEIKSNTKLSLKKIDQKNPADKLMWEKELLGLYVSGHPLLMFKDKLETKDINIKKIKSESRENSTIVIGGIITSLKNVMTKKGDRMVFLKFADLDDSIEAVVFPKVFEEFRDLLILENCIVMKGTISIRNGEKSIVVEKVKQLE